MTYDEILNHFQVKRRYQDKAQCQCPAHDDKQASLTVTKGRGSALIHCHAGCDIDNVLSAAGLKKSDLFYQEKRTGSSWQAYIESREKKKIEAVYNYVSSNGGYLFTKVRMQGKKMIYGTLANERFTYGLGGRTRKELCAIYTPDGVQAINKAVSEGKPIFIGKRRYRVVEIPEADRAEYADTVKRLLAIPVPKTPKAVELDGDADKIAESFFYEIEKEMEDASPEFRAWLGKLHGTTMRIALSLHCLEYIEEFGEHKISGETMGNAIQIGRYFKAHAEAAYNIMGLMDSPEVRDAKYLIKRIESTGLTEIKLRDLQRMCMNRNGMETREGMIPGLVCLIEHGYVRVQKGWTTDKSDKKRGRPSEIIYINPEYIKQKEQK